MKLLNQNVSLEFFFLELSKSKDALLILDYDGTLAPFSEDPNTASPYPGVIERIITLVESKKTKVVILSGRGVENLKMFLNIKPLPELWGSHGGERWLQGAGKPLIKEIDIESKTVLREAANDAQSLAPDLYCEIKPLSVALHWRGKEALAKEHSLSVRNQWRKRIKDLALEIHEFDGGIELRQKNINKGEAVKILLSETPPHSIVAYLGDDLTDEQAFEVLGERALKVLVRERYRPTKADLLIKPPEELFLFLDKWITAQNKVSS